MGYLLDTSVAIHLRDDNERIVLAVGELDPLPVFSVISRVELEGGVFVDPKWQERRRQGLDLLLDMFEVVDFSDAAANTYGKIVEAAGFSRRKIIDRMIAATALVHDLTLVTTNPGDFADIDGLKLEIWTP